MVEFCTTISKPNKEKKFYYKRIHSRNKDVAILQANHLLLTLSKERESLNCPV